MFARKHMVRWLTTPYRDNRTPDDLFYKRKPLPKAA